MMAKYMLAFHGGTMRDDPAMIEATMAACAHAANNPMVVDGSGSVEVAEFVDMV